MSSVEENNAAVGSNPSSDQDGTANVTAATTTQESSGGESDGNGGDIYQHNNYVYILDKEYSWVPAMVTERINETTMNLSIPKYKTEQAIRCDGGRTASRFEKQTIDLNDAKTVALYPNKHLPLQNVNHEGELQVVEDMVDLPFLHEVCSKNCPNSRYLISCCCLVRLKESLTSQTSLTLLSSLLFIFDSRLLSCTT